MFASSSSVSKGTGTQLASTPEPAPAANRPPTSSRDNSSGIDDPETMDEVRDLILNCLIWGEYSSQVFKVTITSCKSIDSLKMAIKAKHWVKLQGVAKEDINVYTAEAVPLPNDPNDLEDNRRFEDDIFRVRSGPQRGRLQKLSEIFRDKLGDEDLHVILDIPQLTIPLRLFCIVRSEVTGFLVNIDRRSSVDELKEAIIKRRTGSPTTWSPTTWSPTIWGVSIPVDDISENFEEMDFDKQEELQPFESLTHYFPIMPNLAHLQIIVEKEKGLLSESDFLKLHPPRLGYINAIKSTKTTISVYACTPESVVIWDRFKEDVNNATWDDVEKYSLPTFPKIPEICNEESVREALNMNVLGILNTVLEQGEKYNRHASLRSITGEPDFIQILNRDLRLVIEVKTKWVLWVDDLVTTYNQNVFECQEKITSPISVYNPVRQIFGYLSYNHLRYGVLTTYDKTWFLFRPPNNPGQLCISPAIQCDDQQPTLFQCFLYLTLLARTEYDCPAPPSLGDGDDEPKPKSGSAKAGGSTPKRGQGHKTPIAGGKTSVKTHPSHPLDFFDWDSFKVLDVLGCGRSGKVFKAVLHGEIVALKICDLWQHPDYNEELLNEVKVYHALEDLQGNCIPRLKSAGYTAGGLFAIATDIVGRPLEDRESLSDEERLAIQRALSSIHRHGFVHGDIRNENILIKRDGGKFYVCFIDFAFSKKGGRSDFRKEKKTLAWFLDGHSYDSNV